MLKIVILSCLVATLLGLPVEIVEPVVNDNAELYGGGFEGDMLLPPKTSVRGVASNGQVRRWPNRIIPYDISAITNANDQATIKSAMNKLMFDVGTPIEGQANRQACVFFRPSQTGDKEVLKIKYGTGCSASVGYGTGYEKSLNLAQNGCFYSGTIQHELTHVLGFFHEQSRPDRDSFIKVNIGNVQTGHEHNFNKYEWGQQVEDIGSRYDYGSIMHYPSGAFSSNGLPTIETKQANVVIGQREKLSATDIAEIRKYYQC